MFQSRVRDLRVHENEIRETCQPFQMHHPGIGDLRVVEAEFCEAGQSIQMHQSSSLSNNDKAALFISLPFL